MEFTNFAHLTKDEAEAILRAAGHNLLFGAPEAAVAGIKSGLSQVPFHGGKDYKGELEDLQRAADVSSKEHPEMYYPSAIASSLVGGGGLIRGGEALTAKGLAKLGIKSIEDLPAILKSSPKILNYLKNVVTAGAAGAVEGGIREGLGQDTTATDLGEVSAAAQGVISGLGIATGSPLAKRAYEALLRLPKGSIEKYSKMVTTAGNAQELRKIKQDFIGDVQKYFQGGAHEGSSAGFDILKSEGKEIPQDEIIKLMGGEQGLMEAAKAGKLPMNQGLVWDEILRKPKSELGYPDIPTTDIKRAIMNLQGIAYGSGKEFLDTERQDAGRFAGMLNSLLKEHPEYGSKAYAEQMKTVSDLMRASEPLTSLVEKKAGSHAQKIAADTFIDRALRDKAKGGVNSLRQGAENDVFKLLKKRVEIMALSWKIGILKIYLQRNQRRVVGLQM
jgi:hypothetical protein